MAEGLDEPGHKVREGHNVFVLARLIEGVHVLVATRDRNDCPRRSAFRQ